jgi:hypothetical protein
MSGQQTFTAVIKGEAVLESVLPQEMMFAFKEFTDAEIHLKNDSFFKTKININLFTADILFLNNSNQVMVMENLAQIKEIKTGGKILRLAGDAFGEIIYKSDTLALVIVKRTKCTDMRKEAGFGGTTSTGSVFGATSFSKDNATHVALSVGEYDFETSLSYFILTGSRTIDANSRGLRKIFPDNRKEIDEFFRKNKTGIANENELIMLIQTCQNIK